MQNDMPTPDSSGNTGQLIDSYYKETLPEKRKALLDKMEETGGDAMLPLRKELFALRYRADGGNAYADGFLMTMMGLLFAAQDSTLFRGIKQKRVKKLLTSFHSEKAQTFGKEGEDVLHRELINAGERYISTCQGSGYRRKFFGLSEASSEEKEVNILKDLYLMSRGIAEKYDLRKETDFLYRGLDEAYRRFSTGAASLESAYKERFRF